MTVKMISVGLSVEEADVAKPIGELTVVPKHGSHTLKMGVPVSDVSIAEIRGGVPPYTVVASTDTGTLPPGVAVTNTAGKVFLTGTPTAAGTSTVQILLDVSDSEVAKATWGASDKTPKTTGKAVPTKTWA